MRFPWIPITREQSAPLLPVGLRRNGNVMATAPLLLVDTGADGTLLHFRWAKLLEFQDADLIEEECMGAGGTMIVYKPKDLARTEIEIGGAWFPIPSLKFGRLVPISLLGRDVIFSHFALRMTASHFELLPLRKNRKVAPRKLASRRTG